MAELGSGPEKADRGHDSKHLAKVADGRFFRSTPDDGQGDPGELCQDARQGLDQVFEPFLFHQPPHKQQRLLTALGW